MVTDGEWMPRRAYRNEKRLLGGVASGVGEHLGVDPTTVRVGFLLLTLVGGFGFFLYLALWAFMPSRNVADEENDLPPGMAVASRTGLRGRTSMAGKDLGLAVSLITCGLGAVFLLQAFGLGVSANVFWPLVVGTAGLALVWLQFDNGGRSLEFARGQHWRSWMRIGAGFALLVLAVVIVLLQAGKFSAVWSVLGVLVLAIAGTLLVVGPWFLRLWRDLQDERTERIRTQERADVAAHLHDSVLQTLALIQRQARDPSKVAALARTQERELRRWLFTTGEDAGASVKAALQLVAEQVEEAHAVPIDVIVVGDAPSTDHTAALVRAAREAMVNSAKHAETAKVDVYAEITDDAIDVFVRDRGRGFEPSAVPADRMGVSGSVVDRMHRHGGTASVRSAPGEGTEVTLHLPVVRERASPDPG